MKAVRSTLLIAAVVLSGCASSGSGADSSQQASWWNPLTYHWSSALPWNWFGSSLTATEQGVGGLTASTAMKEDAINAGLNGDYSLRQGMRSQNGQVVSFWQALDDGNVKLVIYGQSQIERIEVMDSAIASSDGSKVGDVFSNKFSKAFDNCTLASGTDARDVACRAPGSQHLTYVYQGDWHGPEGLMPSDDTLKSWKISKIVWQR
ncbi:RpoE-regulated lipoprotein [Pantoea agglomerans]|uniref:RpoE-regulated lipoprotein n=1 Tax=Enterobacter agglomerans TaxID=549 RepID=UPI001FD6C815|nr:RpoE-regulated lipoprotein [Pantoea agglomerans]UOV19349.1 RpoE-regulated lipoprotein [Pantoea agglomerans]